MGRRIIVNLAVALALAGVCLLAATAPSRAEEDCDRCRELHFYACTQDRDNCEEGCRGVTVTDKDGCRQRCGATARACGQRIDDRCGVCPTTTFRPFRFQAPPPQPR